VPGPPISTLTGASQHEVAACSEGRGPRSAVLYLFPGNDRWSHGLLIAWTRLRGAAPKSARSTASDSQASCVWRPSHRVAPRTP